MKVPSLYSRSASVSVSKACLAYSLLFRAQWQAIQQAQGRFLVAGEIPTDQLRISDEFNDVHPDTSTENLRGTPITETLQILSIKLYLSASASEIRDPCVQNK